MGSINLGMFGLGGAASGVDENSAQAKAAQSFFGERPLASIANEYFPGQSYANFSPESEEAMQMQANQARNPSGLVAGAQQSVTDTLEGKYLNAGNPYMQGITESAVASAMPMVQNQFARAGRSGTSPSAQAMLGREVSRAVAPYAAQSYESERRNQVLAASQAPQIEELGYANAGRLSQVGAFREDQEQRGINEEMARFSQKQQDPWQRAMALINVGYGAPGGASTSTTTGTGGGGGGGPSRAQGAMGGALSGAAAGSMFGPWGAGIGAVGGGLLGAFA